MYHECAFPSTESLNSSESKSKDSTPTGTWKKDVSSSITATLPKEEDVKWTTKQYTSTQSTVSTVIRNTNAQVPKPAPAPVKIAASPPVTPATKTDDGKVTVNVVMNKGAFGLGFCIEGGKGSPLGDRPVLVKRLFKGTYSC